MILYLSIYLAGSIISYGLAFGLYRAHNRLDNKFLLLTDDDKYQENNTIKNVKIKLLKDIKDALIFAFLSWIGVAMFFIMYVILCVIEKTLKPQWLTFKLFEKI